MPFSERRQARAQDLMPGEDLPTGEAKVRAVRGMFDAIAPRYDLVNRVMTFGLDRGWRRKAVAALALPPGSLVVDLAAGTGDLCRDLQTAGHRPVGVDLSWGMLAAARTTTPLVQADVTRLPVPDARADGATCGFALRNLADLDAFLAELARVIRAGGRVAVLEVSEPDSALLRWGHGVYFGKVVPRIGGLLSDRSAYRYLPRSAAYLPEPAELVRRFDAAGFPGTTRRPLGAGAAQLLVATRG